MATAQGPLDNLEQWDDFVKSRYNPEKKQEEFRRYDDTTPPVVREFYRQNHINQTRDFVLAKKKEYAGLTRGEMGVWEAMEYPHRPDSRSRQDAVFLR